LCLGSEVVGVERHGLGVAVLLVVGDGGASYGVGIDPGVGSGVGGCAKVEYPEDINNGEEEVP